MNWLPRPASHVFAPRLMSHQNVNEAVNIRVAVLFPTQHVVCNTFEIPWFALWLMSNDMLMVIPSIRQTFDVFVLI